MKRFEIILWFIVFMVFMICVTAILIMYHPFVIRIETDNNTLEAINSMNLTNIYGNQCQEWEKDIKYFCDDINNNGLSLSDCVLNKCYKEELSGGIK